MKEKGRVFSRGSNRRAFFKQGVAAAGVATLAGGAGLLTGAVPALAREDETPGQLTRGDAAILRFLQALETIEADLWRQYAELGGATKQGVSKIDLPFPNGLAPLYVTGL